MHTLLTSLIMAGVATAAPAFDQPPKPGPDPYAAILDSASYTCDHVAAYVYATGHGPDVELSVNRLLKEWAGTPDLDELALVYRGVIAGCVGALT